MKRALTYVVVRIFLTVTGLAESLHSTGNVGFIVPKADRRSIAAILESCFKKRIQIFAIYPSQMHETYPGIGHSLRPDTTKDKISSFGKAVLQDMIP